MQVEIENAGISSYSLVNSADRKATAKVISQMLAEGSLNKDDFFLAFRDLDFARRLLCANVFSLNIKTRRVSFQSTAMKNFCKEHPEVWRVGD